MLNINKNIVIVDNEENKIILKIKNSDDLIKLTHIEYDIIRYFATVNNKNEIIEHFKSIVEIGSADLDKLIDKALQNHILLTDKESTQHSSFRFTFKKKKRIFEILGIDFSNTFIEKIFENRMFSNICLILLLSTFVYTSYDVFKEPLNFKSHYMQTIYVVPISFTSIIKFIYLASFISVFIHEMGHYLFYKLFGGKTSMFGIGLLFFVLPVFYTKIHASFLKNKSQRIITNLGGLFFDVILFVFLIYFTKHYHSQYPTVCFIAYSAMISICIRSFFNLNPFLPGNDAYYVISDALNAPTLFENCIQNSKELLKNKVLTTKNVMSLIYSTFSYISMGLSWAFMLLPLIIYFYYVVIVRI